MPLSYVKNCTIVTILYVQKSSCCNDFLYINPTNSPYKLYIKVTFSRRLCLVSNIDIIMIYHELDVKNSLDTFIISCFYHDNNDIFLRYFKVGHIDKFYFLKT